MKRLPWLLSFTGLALALSTMSCTTLGTHVKGGFACHAPQGTCAPMSNIDAQAIAGLGTANGQVLPISTDSIDGRARFITTGNEGIPVRTGERVMRVVFPAHTDGHGVFHDEAVAHVVSEPSGWTLRPAHAPTIGSLDAAIAASAPSTRAEAGTTALLSAPGVATSTVPLNLREAAAGLTAPASPLPDPPLERVAVDMPGAPGDGPSAQAIAAARAGHRIGDAMPSRVSARARPQHATGLLHRKVVARPASATVPGAATAELNRAALRELSPVRSREFASATQSQQSKTASSTELPQ
jgi:conjugal transfer pilus assembly protein TraV